MTRLFEVCCSFALLLGCSGSKFSAQGDDAGAGSAAGSAGSGGNAGDAVADAGSGGSADAGSAGNAGSAANTAGGASSGGSAGNDESAGSGGSAGALTLMQVDAASSPLRGAAPSNNTKGVMDSCPPGSLLIGVDVGDYQGFLARARFLCGAPELSASNPSLVLVPLSKELDWNGGALGNVVQSRCPENEVVVSFSGQSGLLLDQLQLRCAPLLRKGNAILPGVDRSLEPVGGTGGTAFPRSECPGGSAASGGVALVFASQYLAAFGLSCRGTTLG